MHEDFVVVEASLMRDGFARVFGRARENEGLGSVESGGCADLAGFLGVDL